MIQMRRHLLIPMSPRRNMEIPLHLIPLQAAIYPTRIRSFPPPQRRALSKLAPRIPPHLPKDMMHMRILLLTTQPSLILMAQRLILMPAAVGLVIALLHPQTPARVLAFEQVAGENAVARGVLDVDAERVAGHVDDDVEV